MPGLTIHRKESESDESKPPSWALIPSPQSARAHAGVDSRALDPFSASSREPTADEHTQDGPFQTYPDNPGGGTDNTTGLTFYFATQVINITMPIVTHFPCPCEIHHMHHGEHSPRPASPRVVVEEPADSDSEDSVSCSPRSPRPRRLQSPPSLETQHAAASFFSFDAAYVPIILPKKRSPAMRAPHEEIIDAFDGVEFSGPVSGLGRFARPLINKYHTSGFVSEFQASGERVLLLPGSSSRVADDDSSGPTTPTLTRRHELERLECEMFDISKYRGAAASTNQLTVLTWASDSHWGSITLFEVEEVSSGEATGKNRHRKRREQEGAARRIRPVAAMEDVPKGILVNMRVDRDIRKTVLEYSSSSSSEGGRYKWRSQVRPGPVYARVLGDTGTGAGDVDEEEEERLYDGTGDLARVKSPKSNRSPRLGTRLGDERVAAVFSSEEEDFYAKRGRRRERRDADGELEREYDDVPDRRRRPRPSSLLKVDDIRARTRSAGGSLYRTKSSTSASSSRTRGRRSGSRADTGIIATVPQFLALLHANRSILEVVSSVDKNETVTTDADETVMRRCIRMTEKPVGKPHTGRDVHVVVLMPNASPWADERIVWTDEDGELEGLRQKVFWDAIGRGRSCSSRASSKASRSSVFEGSRSPRRRGSRSVDGRGPGRRTGGRRSRAADERGQSPPKSARW